MRAAAELAFAGLCALATGSASAARQGEAPEPEPRVLAIENVNVVPMTAGRPGLVLLDRTVVVADGRIAAIAPADELDAPPGARRIAGHDRWLVPGLVDMHCHLLADEHVAAELAPLELEVLVANGVTTARIPIGRPGHLALRERVEAGALVGPRLFVAGPQLAGRAFGDPFHGHAVTTPDEARAAVQRIAADGYDFVKLTFWITPEVHAAAASAARAVHLPLFGHVGPEVGLERALAAGQQIEHLDQYLEWLLPPDASSHASPFPGPSGLGVWRRESWNALSEMDAERIPALARRVAEAGVWSTPTHHFLNTCFGTGFGDAPEGSEGEGAEGHEGGDGDHGAGHDDGDAPGFPAPFLSPEVRAALRAPRERYWSDPPPAELRARFVAYRDAITKALSDAGAPLMAGSDCPSWGLLPGFSLHDELAALVHAGLTPWEALEAATRVPCRWLGIHEDVGTIVPGKTADLVLLEADPLAAIAHTRRISGVIVRGTWLERGRLDEMLFGAAGRLSRAPLQGSTEPARDAGGAQDDGGR